MVTRNQKAFLDMIAVSELQQAVIDSSDNGYNVLFGSIPGHLLLFQSYADHPRIYNSKFDTTAAGRYQLLAKYFDAYKIRLGLPDFSPSSQDVIALQQIKEQHALSNIEAGHIHIAIAQCSNIWASLPGNNYGQHQNKMPYLCDLYSKAGGSIIAA